MAQQLLNRAEVGAGIEQVSGAGVPHGVGVKVAASCPKGPMTPHDVLNLPNTEPATATRQPERVGVSLFRFIEQAGAGGQVRPDRFRRRLAKRHDPLLATLAEDPHLGLRKVAVGEVHAPELADAHSSSVEGLEQRLVAQLEQRRALVFLGRRVHDPKRLLNGQEAWQ